MALDANDSLLRYDAPEKDLYEIGEIPPIGFVPPKMLLGRSAVRDTVNLINHLKLK